MAALSADKFEIGERIQKDVIPIPVATTAVIYNGAMVCWNTSGYAAPAADTASFVFVGIAKEQADNTSGANGAIDVDVKRVGTFKMAFGGTAAVDDVGKQAYVTDDQTVDLVGTTTNDVAVGEIVEFVDTSTVYVDIERRLLS